MCFQIVARRGWDLRIYRSEATFHAVLSDTQQECKSHGTFEDPQSSGRGIPEGPSTKITSRSDSHVIGVGTESAMCRERQM